MNKEIEEAKEILQDLLDEGFEAMCPDEAMAIEKILKYIEELEEKFNKEGE